MEKKFLFIALGPPHTHRSQRDFFFQLFNFIYSEELKWNLGKRCIKIVRPWREENTTAEKKKINLLGEIVVFVFIVWKYMKQKMGRFKGEEKKCAPFFSVFFRSGNRRGKKSLFGNSFYFFRLCNYTCIFWNKEEGL